MTTASKVSHRIDPVDSGGIKKSLRFSGDVSRKSPTALVIIRWAKSGSPRANSRAIISAALRELRRCSSSMAMPAPITARRPFSADPVQPLSSLCLLVPGPPGCEGPAKRNSLAPENPGLGSGQDPSSVSQSVGRAPPNTAQILPAIGPQPRATSATAGSWPGRKDRSSPRRRPIQSFQRSTNPASSCIGLKVAGIKQCRNFRRR